MLGAVCLVAGTAIGAGMLGLPVVTAEGGFMLSCAMYLLCYLFSMVTGLLLLEICTWMPRQANLVTMAQLLLGRWGKWSAWILYVFLFYSLTVAYILGGGAFISAFVGQSVPFWVSALLFVTFFGCIVFRGAQSVNKVNVILFIGLLASFILFIGLGVSHIQIDLLKEKFSVYKAILGLPVMFTSFSYQGIVPTLYAYLDEKAEKVKKAIVIGSFIPFIIYIIWQAVILGMIPLEGSTGLLAAKANGWTAVEPLKYLLNLTWISKLGSVFAFCALTTSFFGVTLPLIDFLSDGLHIKRKGRGRLFLASIIFFPCYLIAAMNPNLFLVALGYAGGIGCVLLLGFLPTLMVWIGRYNKGYGQLNFRVKGGKWLLVLLFIFIASELSIEIVQEVKRALGSL